MTHKLQELAQIVRNFFSDPAEAPERLCACRVPGHRDREYERTFDAKARRAIEEKIRTREALIARGIDPERVFLNRTGEFSL